PRDRLRRRLLRGWRRSRISRTQIVERVVAIATQQHADDAAPSAESRQGLKLAVTSRAALLVHAGEGGKRRAVRNARKTLPKEIAASPWVRWAGKSCLPLGEICSRCGSARSDALQRE